MDFARKQLEKYGWSEGKGLGKNEDGISSALKPKLKFDNSGVGHEIGEQFTNNWWEKLFNNAAQNIDVEVDKSEIKMKIKCDDAVEITTKSYSLKMLKKNKNLEYGSFLKTATLTENGVENYNVDSIKVVEAPKAFQVLTDDELFAACEGRTAHKGARHGLKLSGKLSRIEKQEKMLLKKMKKVSLSDDKTNVEKKLKKLKKQGDETSKKETPDTTADQTYSSLKKKSNKKRKSVTFSETTVTKYYSADLDTSFDSEVSSIRDDNSNEPIGSDEGIEQDLENNNNDQLDDHRSFEEAQFNLIDLSKAERKKLKKKKKLEAKTNTSTVKFLKAVFDEDDGSVEEDDVMADDLEDKDVNNSKKRKFYGEDPECSDSKRNQTESEVSADKHSSKKSKKKQQKQMKMELKQINLIAKSLDNFCRISDDE